MSGIVSLLFCGITLKHYAYHTMSQKTQRATKYIFSTLARLSENFIFIYLGIALFTSAPTSEPVMSYVKPLFITITTVAVVFTRYAAVFPLSEGINFFHKHARGQRTEELPHSYQMMLFWAGLRGAVGVALAAGFQGRNAQILRTTVLVVVVLTVLLFGGTTARMLEVLGIRTGVEDDAASSSEDEDIPTGRNWSGRRSSGRFSRYMDDEPSALPPIPGYARNAVRVGAHYSTRNYNHHGQAANVQDIFSASSSDSFDSDAGEVLPLASAQEQQQQQQQQGAHPPRLTDAALAAGVGEDGKWFQALDERYLLPLFSNATASRTFHARRARRNTSGTHAGATVGSPGDSEDDSDIAQELELGHASRGPGATIDESRTERGLPSPALRSNSFGGDGRVS